jgi:hypothetical protein
MRLHFEHFDGTDRAEQLAEVRHSLNTYGHVPEEELGTALLDQNSRHYLASDNNQPLALARIRNFDPEDLLISSTHDAVFDEFAIAHPAIEDQNENTRLRLEIGHFLLDNLVGTLIDEGIYSHVVVFSRPSEVNFFSILSFVPFTAVSTDLEGREGRMMRRIVPLKRAG